MSRVTKCYNCNGEGHFARECPSGIHVFIQNPSKREKEQPDQNQNVISANASDILPRTARKMKGLETMIVIKIEETSPKKEKILGSSEKEGPMVLAASTAKR